MEQEDHTQIMQSIGELKGLVVGITQRLDIANGRTGKNEEKIDGLEKNQRYLDGKLFAFGWVFGAIIGIGGIILTGIQIFK